MIQALKSNANTSHTSGEECSLSSSTAYVASAVDLFAFICEAAAAISSAVNCSWEAASILSTNSSGRDYDEVPPNKDSKGVRKEPNEGSGITRAVFRNYQNCRAFEHRNPSSFHNHACFLWRHNYLYSCLAAAPSPSLAYA